MSGATSYFVRLGEGRFRATDLTSGAWSTTEQHISPLHGLVAHELERYAAARGDDGLVLGRFSFDILGVVGVEEFETDVAVVRAGRTIELLEATATWRGRTVLRARAWRLAATDTSVVAGGLPEPLAGPDTAAPWAMAELWPGGYIASLDVRTLAPPLPGRTTAWVSTPHPLLPDEEVSELAAYVGLVDTANGIAVRRSPEEWLFPNLDLTIHLFRSPSGPWVGLDTTVTWGPSGHGLTATVLHDESGPVGRAEQLLTLRPRTVGGR